MSADIEYVSKELAGVCLPVEGEEMKLYLFFVLIDLLIVLAYPFIFVASKVRKYFRFKG
jgi:hypothetical protein